MTEWYRVFKGMWKQIKMEMSTYVSLCHFFTCYTLGSVLERQELLRAARGGGGQYPLLCAWTLWFARPSCHSVEGCDGGQGISKRMIHLVKHIDRIRWATLTLLLEVSGPFGGATLLPDVLFMVEIVETICCSSLLFMVDGRSFAFHDAKCFSVHRRRASFSPLPRMWCVAPL